MSTVPESQKIDRVYAISYNSAFAQKAQRILPELQRWKVVPKEVVRFEPSNTTYFKTQSVHLYSIQELSSKLWGKSDEFILDFGSHNVGYVRFHLGAQGTNIDAPTRLKLTFGEVPFDVTEELHPCRSWISTSWLPDEVVNVDWVPSDVVLPRRYAFRYLRVQILDTSPKYKVSFTNIEMDAVSSATNPSSLDSIPTSDELLRKIDLVSANTLRSCMQTVFEDGPRRDRRLWSGDLRLQALTNYCTFKNYDLVKRCLYMFAAVPREDGSLPACVFEKPELAAATDYIVDYDVLFGSIVYDYCLASGDLETGVELWETVLGSTKSALAHVGTDFLFSSQRSEKWKFVDWSESLDRDASMHGLIIFALEKVDSLARLISKSPLFGDTITGMIKAAQDAFYDTNLQVFVSGPERQVSWASQAWMALGGVAEPAICKGAIIRAMSDPKAIKPLTPYLYHHVAEALSIVGAQAECIKLIREYWGGMVNAGADTFWECFDPEDNRSSPYGDCHNNSYCHAWSCTPSYLLRVQLREYLLADHS